MAADMTAHSRTPSLPHHQQSPEKLRGLGLEGQSAPVITTDYDYDFHKGINDTPDKESASGRTESPRSRNLSPRSNSVTSFTLGGLSPNSGTSYTTPMTTPYTGTTDGGFDDPFGPFHTPNPFNFTTQQYVAGKGLASRTEAVGKRRGHKYRHSSIHVSAMGSIVQAPVVRAPLALPASLPMPTRKEAWRSLTSNQTLRLSWCVCHFLIASYVQFSGAGSLAMTALSRLLLFDAAGATVCVFVDVMGNFEVWKRSSIKHPFGLERADVLAGFAMSVFISFMGLDVVSHGVEHSLENIGSHTPHNEHEHQRVSTGSVDVASALAIVATLVSALLLKNHRRIGKAIRFSTIASWGRIFGNPSHFLTLSCSALLLTLPLLSIKTYALFDLLFSILIAMLMIAFGVRLGTSLAFMLLMSYKPAASNPSIRQVMDEIETDPGVSTVEEARFWQVHYGLCMANLKVRFRGAESEMARIRSRISSLIRQKLDGSWEVSMQMSVEKD